MAKKIRLLVGKLGSDTHTIGITVVAQALRDAGMEVISTMGTKTSAISRYISDWWAGRP